MTSTRLVSATTGSETRAEFFREAVTTVLCVSVVEIAELAAPFFRGERPTRYAALIGLVQIGGAMFVASVSSLPVLVFSDVRAQEITGDVPALLIGVVAYLVARTAARPRVASCLYGVTVLALGVLVAFVKSIFAAH